MSRSASGSSTQASTTAGDGRNQRAAERRSLCLPGRIIWRDRRGRQRTSRVQTRDVSAVGVFVECVPGCPALPRYRLVDLKLDEAARLRDDVPGPLKQPRVPTAVYRVGATDDQTGMPSGFGLRLLIKPARRPAPGRELRAG